MTNTTESERDVGTEDPQESLNEHSETGAPGRRGRSDLLSWLVPAAGYLVLAIAVWWNVWSKHPTSVSACPCGDAGLVTWFLAWPAYAISHGVNPFYSTAMFHPMGVNLLSNASSEAFGFVLAPVTWLFGPIATLNVALTLAPFLSALAMFWLLRRWVSWVPAAFVGGLVYGFSPFIVSEIALGHLMSSALMVPPLLVGGLDELIFRRQRSPVRVGIGLGALVVVQFFVSTEMLAILAITGTMATVVLVGYGLARHRAALRAARRHVGIGLGTASGVSVLALAYPAWFALAGPAHLGGAVWGYPEGGFLANSLLSAPAAHAAPDFLARISGYQGRFALPPVTYLGLGVVVVVAGGLVAFRRDKRLLFFVVLGVASAVLGLRHVSNFMGHLPVLQSVIPARLITITWLSIGVVVALTLDHARIGVAAATRRRGEAARPPLPLLGTAAALLIAIVAIVPIAQVEGNDLPLPTARLLLPKWFAHSATHVPHGSVLLVAEPGLGRGYTLVWQAMAHMRYSVVDGNGPELLAKRMPNRERPGYEVLQADLSALGGSLKFTAYDVKAVNRALRGWGVTTVVLPGIWRHSRPATLQQVLIDATMTYATSRAPVLSGQVLVWPTGRTGHRLTPSPTRYAQCTASVTQTDQLLSEGQCLSTS